jgi:repressor LexA
MHLDELTSKQRDVLESIITFLEESGYPPSIQQLCIKCDVKSTSTIHHHLTALKKKGFIHWNPSERRAITVHETFMNKRHYASHNEEDKASDHSGALPILGSIAAGQPLQTTTDTHEMFDFTEQLVHNGCYLLRVRGESMIEDHIMDGDLVLVNSKARVKDGDVVVALIDGETATLKRIYKEADHIRLQPANRTMDPILVKSVDVQGKVEAVIRQI